jgi:hypothetical protein
MPEKTDEDLESLVRETYIERARAQVFAEIGVHLTEDQIINYCLNHTINSKIRQSKN